MKFLIVFALVGLAAADVSHLASSYLPPRVSSPVINYNHGSDAIISRPIVSTYTTQQKIIPEVTYSRQVNVAPSVQVIGGGYDSGFIGSGISDGGYSGSSGLSGYGGSYGNGGLIGAYDSGLSGGSIYQGGLGGSGYQSSGLIGGGLVGSGLGAGSNVIRTISAPAISNAYESIDTQYGSNGGYVYQKKH